VDQVSPRKEAAKDNALYGNKIKRCKVLVHFIRILIVAKKQKITCVFTAKNAYKHTELVVLKKKKP